MSDSPTIPETATKLYHLLEPLTSDARHKAVAAVFAMLGESAGFGPTTGSVLFGSVQGGDPALKQSDSVAKVSSKAQLWLRQNEISDELLFEVFHYNGASFEYIGRDVPGDSNRSKTKSCYLLTGIASFLLSGEAAFQDSDARYMCEKFGCYDGANHSGSIKALALSGSKASGFSLTVPALRAGAGCLKESVAL